MESPSSAVGGHASELQMDTLEDKEEYKSDDDCDEPVTTNMRRTSSNNFRRTGLLDELRMSDLAKGDELSKWDLLPDRLCRNRDALADANEASNLQDRQIPLTCREKFRSVVLSLPVQITVLVLIVLEGLYFIWTCLDWPRWHDPKLMWPLFALLCCFTFELLMRFMAFGYKLFGFYKSNYADTVLLLSACPAPQLVTPIHSCSVSGLSLHFMGCVVAAGSAHDLSCP